MSLAKLFFSVAVVSLRAKLEKNWSYMKLLDQQFIATNGRNINIFFRQEPSTFQNAQRYKCTEREGSRL